MAVLWAGDEPLSPRQVQARLDSDLAYTTVMTVLTRLWNKGVLDRRRVNRAYVYSPKFSEADLVAARMHDMLDKTSDPDAVLSRFVGILSDDEAVVLRDFLGANDT